MEQGDHELLTRLAGDLRYHFPQLVMLYQHRLYAFALRLSGSRQNAEDIVQEAFVGAYVSLENYPPERIQNLRLQPWLYQITLHVYQHHTRSARLHLMSLERADEQIALALEDREEERPETLFEQQESQQELIALVALLPERYRIAITCYYFEHLSYQEIADLLEQPVGTVKSTVSRGIRRLRTLLDIPNAKGKEKA